MVNTVVIVVHVVVVEIPVVDPRKIPSKFVFVVVVVFVVVDPRNLALK